MQSIASAWDFVSYSSTMEGWRMLTQCTMMILASLNRRKQNLGNFTYFRSVIQEIIYCIWQCATIGCHATCKIDTPTGNVRCISPPLLCKLLWMIWESSGRQCKYLSPCHLFQRPGGASGSRFRLAHHWPLESGECRRGKHVFTHRLCLSNKYVKKEILNYTWWLWWYRKVHNVSWNVCLSW